MCETGPSQNVKCKKPAKKWRFFEGLFRREATSAPGLLGRRVRLCAGTHAGGPGGVPLPPGAGKFRVSMRKTAQPLACEKISPYKILSSPGHRGAQVSLQALKNTAGNVPDRRSSACSRPGTRAAAQVTRTGKLYPARAEARSPPTPGAWQRLLATGPQD